MIICCVNVSLLVNPVLFRTYVLKVVLSVKRLVRKCVSHGLNARTFEIIENFNRTIPGNDPETLFLKLETIPIKKTKAFNSKKKFNSIRFYWILFGKILFFNLLKLVNKSSNQLLLSGDVYKDTPVGFNH